MKTDRLTGTQIPRFSYDTPTQAQRDFYALCDDDRPLLLVFLPNYGHPISRVYLQRYCRTLAALQSGRLACVVRSRPQSIAPSLTGEYPFPLICDVDGVLYGHFGVEKTNSRLHWSFSAAKILRDARRQGYTPDPDAGQLLPLTMVVGREGQVLYAYHGRSLTDMPEDCRAMEKVCSRLLAALDRAAAQDADEEEYDDTDDDAGDEEQAAEDAPSAQDPERDERQDSEND